MSEKKEVDFKINEKRFNQPPLNGGCNFEVANNPSRCALDEPVSEHNPRGYQPLLYPNAPCNKPAPAKPAFQHYKPGEGNRK